MASFLSVVSACDDLPYDDSANEYYKFFLPGDPQPVGYMLPSIVAQMPWDPNDFNVSQHPPRVDLHPSTDDSASNEAIAARINAALARLIDRCLDQNVFRILGGRHSERCAIISSRYGPTAPVHIERFAMPLFGLVTRGVHLVAYFHDHASSSSPTSTLDHPTLRIWISRRAPHLFAYPNALDSTAAGGVQAGTSARDTIVAEAGEEASFPAELVRAHARSVGALTHMGRTGAGFAGESGLVTPDYIYVYDLEVGADVVPRPCDDEVGAFRCMRVVEVVEALRRGEFKPDAAAVMVDFLMRHGVITPENEPEYVEITMRLHRRLPFRIAPDGV